LIWRRRSTDGGQFGRYHLVYNGEVYNYIELRQELESQGCRFSTHSDTEVLLQCLARHGPAALSKLDGMFAFAYGTAGAPAASGTRPDRNQAPLLFLPRPDLIFASEIKALLQHPLAARTLDPLSVSKYFSYGYVPAPHTVFEKIHKVEPGAWLKFDANGLSREFYWDIPLTDNPVGRDALRNVARSCCG